MNVSGSRFTSISGKWVVLAMIGLAAAAGVISVTYWHSRAKEKSVTVGEPAGSSPWDPIKARQELEETQGVVQDALSQKAFANAISQAERLVEKYPRYAPARRLLAQALLADGRLQAGYDQLKRSLEFNDRQPELHAMAGTTAFEMGNHDLAIHHYSKAVGLDQQSPRYRLLLATMYLKRERFDEARRLTLEALTLDSTSHEAYATLSDLYARQNLLGLALEQIDRAIRHTPIAQRATAINYIRQKAALQRRDNRPEESLSTLLSLSPRERAEPAIVREMSACFAMMDQPERAAGLYEQLFLAAPTELEWISEAARWRIKAGDRETAQRHLAAIQKLNPRAPVIEELQRQLQRP